MCLFFSIFNHSVLLQILQISEMTTSAQSWVSWILKASNPKGQIENGDAMLILLMAEIRRSPVEVGSLSRNLQSFLHPWWLALGFLNHQQYYWSKPFPESNSQIAPGKTGRATKGNTTRLPTESIFYTAMKPHSCWTYEHPLLPYSKRRSENRKTTFLPCLQVNFWKYPKEYPEKHLHLQCLCLKDFPSLLLLVPQFQPPEPQVAIT